MRKQTKRLTFARMNFEFFIAKRLLRQEGSTYSRPIVRIATISIALSIAVMIVSVGVLNGFKNQIKEKITGFTSHIHIQPYSLDVGSPQETFSLSNEELGCIRSLPEVRTVQPYILQAGAIKTKSDFQGVLLKGVDKNFDYTFFKDNLCEGKLPDTKSNTSSEALISKVMADKMQLKPGDKLRVYFFIDGQYRVRPFKVSGIYQTGLGDYDQRFILVPASVLQRLNDLESEQFNGYEVGLNNFSSLEKTANALYRLLPQDKTVLTIDEVEPGLFAWLSLLDSNVVLIIIIMTLVTITAACSSLLVMVFEQRGYISLLKSMGARTHSIMTIYLYKACYIIGKAMLFGNMLAIGLGFVQSKYKIIKLNRESYYLDSVPFELNWTSVVVVNIAVVVVCTAALLIPARSIGRISPAENIDRK